MVYVDPSAWKNVEELAFCLSYHCLDTVYEGWICPLHLCTFTARLSASFKSENIQVLVVISRAHGLIPDMMMMMIFRWSGQMEVLFLKEKSISVTVLPAVCKSPLVCLIPRGAFCAVWVRSLAVYTKKFTRAHRGSLPTPKQIMQVLIEQEKARGSRRAARYLRFIFSLV